jgi:HSP20 family protein
VNISRQETGYVISMAVAGLSKNDIKIEVNDGQLIISANEVKNDSNPNYVRREFDYNGFKRSFRLHENANTEAMSASFDQGILTIVVPDKEPETRKIEIL